MCPPWAPNCWVERGPAGLASDPEGLEQFPQEPRVWGICIQMFLESSLLSTLRRGLFSESTSGHSVLGPWCHKPYRGAQTQPHPPPPAHSCSPDKLPPTPQVGAPYLSTLAPLSCSFPLRHTLHPPLRPGVLSAPCPPLCSRHLPSISGHTLQMYSWSVHGSTSLQSRLSQGPARHCSPGSSASHPAWPQAGAS